MLGWSSVRIRKRGARTPIGQIGNWVQFLIEFWGFLLSQCDRFLGFLLSQYIEANVPEQIYYEYCFLCLNFAQILQTETWLISFDQNPHHL
jgi:hypothetical protein